MPWGAPESHTTRPGGPSFGRGQGAAADATGEATGRDAAAFPSDVGGGARDAHLAVLLRSAEAQEAAVRRAPTFDQHDAKAANNVTDASFIENRFYLSCAGEWPSGGFAAAAYLSEVYHLRVLTWMKEPTDLYPATNWRFEVLPSHYFAMVRGILGPLVLGSFRSVEFSDLMSRPSKLTVPVRLERRQHRPFGKVRSIGAAGIWRPLSVWHSIQPWETL